MKKLAGLILTIAVFVSCQKVVNVDLNNASPQYVIQSVLLGGENDFNVKITKTTSYFDPKEPETVTNAVVTLYDYNNAAFPVAHQENGNYITTNFTAEVGKTYTLKVEVDGKTFEAKTEIPAKVTIDNAALYEEEEDGEAFIGVYLEFQDPSAVKNYYQFTQSINGESTQSEGVRITEDFGTNGTLMSDFITISQDLKSGDVIQTELRSIDSKSYLYFSTIENIANGGDDGPGGTAPANPATNWSNGALGYFGGGNSDYSIITIP